MSTFIETITWHREGLPDSDELVLGSMPAADCEPVWPVYHDGDRWMMSEGFPCPHPVEAWASMPAGQPTHLEAAA